MLRTNTLEELVENFERNVKYVTSNTYNETSTRIEYIDPLFNLLGWDVNNVYGLPMYLREVIHEATVSVEEGNYRANKKPDYSFQLNGNIKFFVEAKKPSVNILESKEAAFQIRRYGWSANLPFSVLTNFKDIVIYDCSVMPNEEDDPRVARLKIYNYKDFLEKWPEIWNDLSKEQNENQLLNSNLKRERNSFDSYFLNQIKKWRLSLGINLHENNIHIDEEELNLYVQKFINKSLFLRICEDKNLERYEQLKDIPNYEELKQLFHTADARYNSGIFYLIEESELVITFNVISSIYQDLYYPQSSYDFAVIPTYVLANVYDVFLSEKLVIENEKVIIQRKKEALDSLGAVSTPKEIADMIVNESLEIRINNGEMNNFPKIIDICCGSGIFLVSAFQKLIQNYTTYLMNQGDSIAKGLLLKEGNNYKLSYSIKKRILKESIFGIDIDSSAVEVCKFSLLLSCIEDLSVAERDYFSNGDGLLPNLEENIINGNSLITNQFYDFNSTLSAPLGDRDIRNIINPISIEEEFGHAEFDIVVGNPPYIRVQKIAALSPIEYKFLRSSYCDLELSDISALDKYYLFINRAVSLLKKDVGVCGFIVPNRFIHEKNGKRLREYLTKKRLIKKLVNFNEILLFENYSAYTSLLFLSKGEYHDVQYISLTQKTDKPIREQLSEQLLLSTSTLSANPWETYDNRVRQWYDTLDSSFKPLNHFTNVFVGLQTSNDKFYYIRPLQENNDVVRFQDYEGKEREIEKAILREAINDQILEKYTRIKSNRYMIFPYKETPTGATIIPKEELKNEYPLAYEYFSSYKDILLKRSIQGLDQNQSNWYCFGRRQSINEFYNGEMLIWPVLTLSSNFVYAPSPMLFTGGGNGPYYGLKTKDSCSVSIFYLQALLNTSFISQFIEQSSVYFDGGYYSSGKQYVVNVPIKTIDFANKKEREFHNKVVQYVKTLMELNREKRLSSQSGIKKRIERQITVKSTELESLIKCVYGVL